MQNPMKRQSTLTRIVTLGLWLVGSTAAFGEPSAVNGVSDADVARSVLETNAKMTQAANNMDFDGFFSYMVDSDQCVILQNGKVFKSRAEALESIKKGYMDVTKVDRRFDHPQVTVISPDVALLASEGHVAATLTDGRTVETRFAVSLVFVKRDGQWKVLQGHYSMPPRM